jgi:transcription-repair coupling factor (superfamily II helicase)
MSEIEDRFGPLPEPALNLFYILSLRQSATLAGIEEILMDGDDVVVRFQERRTVDTGALSRTLGVPVQARANQLRFLRGRGSAWMPVLRALVDSLSATTAVPAGS